MSKIKIFESLFNKSIRINSPEFYKLITPDQAKKINDIIKRDLLLTYLNNEGQLYAGSTFRKSCFETINTLTKGKKFFSIDPAQYTNYFSDDADFGTLVLSTITNYVKAGTTEDGKSKISLLAQEYNVATAKAIGKDFSGIRLETHPNIYLSNGHLTFASQFILNELMVSICTTPEELANFVKFFNIEKEDAPHFTIAHEFPHVIDCVKKNAPRSNQELLDCLDEYDPNNEKVTSQIEILKKTAAFISPNLINFYSVDKILGNDGQPNQTPEASATASEFNSFASESIFRILADCKTTEEFSEKWSKLTVAKIPEYFIDPQSLYLGLKIIKKTTEKTDNTIKPFLGTDLGNILDIKNDIYEEYLTQNNILGNKDIKDKGDDVIKEELKNLENQKDVNNSKLTSDQKKSTKDESKSNIQNNNQDNPTDEKDVTATLDDKVKAEEAKQQGKASTNSDDKGYDTGNISLDNKNNEDKGAKSSDKGEGGEFVAKYVTSITYDNPQLINQLYLDMYHRGSLELDHLLRIGLNGNFSDDFTSNE